MAVPEAVERVLSFLSVPLGRKRVQVERDLEVGLPEVVADPDELQQVLLNLVLNASQAVDEGGRVVVRAHAVSAGGPGVRIEVEDDGPGVPEALRERIFDPFFTTRPDGTGLGLAVCARVVASHGGDVVVGRGALGGASFAVQLPAVPPGDAHPAGQASREVA
ncbi:MAG: ATP-binding protein [Anaeromyxobacteraceae bacterium]